MLISFLHCPSPLARERIEPIRHWSRPCPPAAKPGSENRRPGCPLTLKWSMSGLQASRSFPLLSYTTSKLRPGFYALVLLLGASIAAKQCMGLTVR